MEHIHLALENDIHEVVDGFDHDLSVDVVVMLEVLESVIELL